MLIALVIVGLAMLCSTFRLLKFKAGSKLLRERGQGQGTRTGDKEVDKDKVNTRPP